MIIILVLCLSLVSCDNEVILENNENTPLANVQLPEKQVIESTDDEPEEMVLEPWTLASYLMSDYDLLSEEALNEVQGYLDRINELEQNYSEDNASDIEALYVELDDLLESYGLAVAVTSYEDFIENNKDAFTEEAVEELLKVTDDIQQLNESDPENESLDGLYESLENLLLEAGFDPKDVISEVEMGSTIYAKYDASGQLVNMSAAADERQIEKYEHIVLQAKKVISDEMIPFIRYIIINTDGVDNVLGYMENEDETLTTWRMVLDIKDAYDEEGQYRKDFDETIVHEFAHLLTLNKDQMQSESSGTYETQEGITKKDAYLNVFYQKFWTSIYDDFESMVDPMDETGESAYAFYEKYEDQFVSDYAATNPEEDFAETFRIFVFYDQPSGETIKDQKVQHMYESETLLILRNRIRKNLNLNE